MTKGALWLLSLILVFTGCKDNPYREPKEVLPPEQHSYQFGGIIELGTPVSGANVAAHKFSGLKKGEQVGKTISNRDGTYDLKFKTDYDGPLLLTASGGLYRDLVTGEKTALKPQQELKSAITHIKMPERTNINAWTTLAVARVLADRGFWDKRVAQLADIDRINVDFSHMSYFLSGKPTNFINIRRQEYFDVEQGFFEPEAPKVILHLAHGGLSQIANDFSSQLIKDGIVVSVLDLITALSDDLSDRVFDGKSASGNTVFIGDNHRINLSSYTMRKQLSEAILLYAQRLQGVGKLTDEGRRYLEAPGRMLEYISEDDQPELFPQSEEPKPIDKEPPELRIAFAYKHSVESAFAFLEGDVTFDVKVNDDTKVKSVRLLEPPMIEMRAANKFGPIGVAQEPQAMIAAEACGKRRYLEKEIESRKLDEASLICACFEAKDIFNNARKELSCFQREGLKSTIDFPTDQTVLSGKSFAEGVTIKARVTSGMPIYECSWRIQDRLVGVFDDHGVLPHGNGLINDTTCTIEENLDGEKFFNGNYYLVLNAKDQGERILSKEQDGIYRAITNFQVFKEPPAVEITSPSNNDFIGTDFIQIFGTATDAHTIKEIRLGYRGIGLDNEGMKGGSNVPLKADSSDWSVSLGEELPEGEYALDLAVMDIYGNEKAYPSRKITLDHQAPVIKGFEDGVSQEPYLQETTNYRQKFVDDSENPHYEVFPVGEPMPIRWHRIPTINRWLTRIDDQRTAPSYTIRVNDDNRLKEVKYALNYRCVPLEDAIRTAHGQDGRYDIWLVQNVASFDLSRDSETDGHLQKYCLSIWAIDQAGNAENHNVEFIWKVVPAPIGIDMNSDRYRAHRSEDDLMYAGIYLWDLFRFRDPIKLKSETAIGHIILANPHLEPVKAMLELEKPIELKTSEGVVEILPHFLAVRYHAYDLKNEEVGPSRHLMDQSVIINPKEDILAKIVLTKAIPIPGAISAKDNFWKSFNLEIDLKKVGEKTKLVDGLKLISRDPYTDQPSNKYNIPWGDTHYVRRRSAARFGI
jgi:hypothetical protein